MPYIVTYRLNRDENSYYIINSLDDLSKQIADHIMFSEDYEFDYGDDKDARAFDLIDVIELGKSVKTKDLVESAYADAQIKIDLSTESYREKEEERSREAELRELNRLKAIYEKQK